MAELESEAKAPGARSLPAGELEGEVPTGCPRGPVRPCREETHTGQWAHRGRAGAEVWAPGGDRAGPRANAQSPEGWPPPPMAWSSCARDVLGGVARPASLSFLLHCGCD